MAKRRTRGLVINDDAAEASAESAPQAELTANPTNNSQPQQPRVQAAVAKSAPAEPQGGKISESRITFEFGSDRLTPYAKRVLNVFGVAVQSPQLQNVSFVIEGHTDGTGSDQYNLDLSRKRAESVIRYLVDVVAVDPTRLAARGKGRRELVNPDDPAAAENRRVVWISQR